MSDTVFSGDVSDEVRAAAERFAATPSGRSGDIAAMDDQPAVSEVVLALADRLLRDLVTGRHPITHGHAQVALDVTACETAPVANESAGFQADSRSAMAPVDFIKWLTDQELASIQSEVDAGRSDTKVKDLDERGSSQELIRRQYSGRYPFELLQNANDAGVDVSAGARSVEFRVTETALLVGDCGSGFGLPQIESICTLGRSSKNPAKSIGHKGLGFKSVGEITDDPQILTTKVGFHFDSAWIRREVENRVETLPDHFRLPLYAFPTTLAQSELDHDGPLVGDMFDRGFNTVFRLPFKDGCSSATVASQLKDTITSRLLLFLEEVDRLSVHGTASDFDAQVVREARENYTEILIDSEGKLDNWIVFSDSVPIPSDIDRAALGDSWGEMSHANIAVAIQMVNGVPVRRQTEPLHVYFPTQDDSGFGFILNADFNLELDRKRTASGDGARTYNVWLATELGRFTGEVIVPGLLERFGNSPEVFQALVPLGVTGQIASAFRDSFTECLRTIPVVACNSGVFRPADCLVLAPGVPPAEQAHTLLGEADSMALVHPSIQADPACLDFLISDLGTGEISTAELLGAISPPTNHLRLLYYKFLLDWAEQEPVLARLLPEFPCVEMENGEWRSPSETIFFPPRSENNAIPTELSPPIAIVPDVDGIEELLREAGVETYDARSLLTRVVIPLLVDKQTAPAIRSVAMSSLAAYALRSDNQDRTVQTAAAKVLLRVMNADGAIGSRWVTADKAYLSEPWLGHNRLEQIYGPFERVEFVCADQDGIRRDAEGLALLRWLGVAEHPRVLYELQRMQTRLTSGLSHPHKSDHPKTWQDWWKTSQVKDGTECQQGHPQSQTFHESRTIDRIESILLSQDFDRLCALWEELQNGWRGNYSTAMQSEFRCRHSQHHGDRSRSVPSLVSHALQFSSWIPTMLRGQQIFSRPSQVSRLTPEVRNKKNVVRHLRYLPDQLSSGVSDEMADNLGMMDVARPSVEGLIELLSELRGAALDKTTDVSDCARWAMRSLNLAVQEVGTPAGDLEGKVPLLIRSDEGCEFSHKPYVSTNRSLEDAWYRSKPILHADADLHALIKAADLKQLEDAATIKPIFTPADQRSEDSLQHALDEAAPWILALCTSLTPSRETDVRRGLRKLHAIACSQLELRYELGGEAQDIKSSAHIENDDAYLSIRAADSQPDWLGFAPHFSRYLNVVSNSDKIAALLRYPSDRVEHLAQQNLGEAEIETARSALNKLEDDNPSEVFLPQPIVDTSILDQLDDSLPDAQRDTTAQPLAFAVAPRSEPGSDNQTDAQQQGESLTDDVVLPPVDLNSVVIIVAPTPPNVAQPIATHDPNGSYSEPTGNSGSKESQRTRTQVGSRGESVVFDKQRQQLKEASQNPDLVLWRSREYPNSPYDIETVDEDNSKVYIEVKSTTGSDPYASFDISINELKFAYAHRSSYQIHRVTDTNSAKPVITVFKDVADRLQDGSAAASASGAKVRFSRDSGR